MAADVDCACTWLPYLINFSSPLICSPEGVQKYWARCRAGKASNAPAITRFSNVFLLAVRPYVLEDYTGKTELVLFGDDFVRHQAYLELGATLLVTGCFKARYREGEYEFKISNLMLAENIKRALTKQVHLELEARHLQPQIIEMLEKQVKEKPGNTGLKISLVAPKEHLKVALSTLGGGIEMTYDFIEFLETSPEIGLRVETAS